MNNLKSLGVACLLIGLILILRMIPHPANFAPVTAVALFSGFFFGKKYSVAVPLLGMFLSDLFLGWYAVQIMLSVYGSFLLIALLGMILKKHKGMVNTISFSLASSILFFTITNLSVWLFSGMYSKTVDGLILCYTYAIPFFKNTLAGDLFYTAVIFGCYAFIVAFKNSPVWKFKHQTVAKIS